VAIYHKINLNNKEKLLQKAAKGRKNNGTNNR